MTTKPTKEAIEERASKMLHALASTLSSLRNERGLTIAQVTALTGISSRTLQNAEQGKTLQTNTLARLLALYNANLHIHSDMIGIYAWALNDRARKIHDRGTEQGS